MTTSGLGNETDEDRVVGADRVLAVLVELANHPTGVTLDELAQRMGSSKSTIHRALASLRRAGLASQPSRGTYLLGDEFLRLAFMHHEARPEEAHIKPALERLAATYGEAAHYAVLDGVDVVYRAKVNPPVGGIRLTSVIGGRNAAHASGVGKVLLAAVAEDLEQLLERYAGVTALTARTPRTVTSVRALWDQLVITKKQGYGVDDEESENGIACLAVPVHNPAGKIVGAVSVSALVFRTPLARLIDDAPKIQAIVNGEQT